MARVVSIRITPVEGAPTQRLDVARLLAHRGIEGDHHCPGEAPETPRNGRDVTLIEAEALAAAKREYDVEISADESRRNILTEGVALNHLVGREFRVGEARLLGVRLCEPCAYLEKLTRPGVREALVHRGGLRATVLEGGTVRPGDAIVPA
jgi:MOSC domain-containing protein YiiM